MLYDDIIPKAAHRVGVAIVVTSPQNVKCAMKICTTSLWKNRRNLSAQMPPRPAAHKHAIETQGKLLFGVGNGSLW